jgi:hypothetical protein
MTRTARTREERMVEAEVRSTRALADANEASEKGQKEKAERLYDRAQYWLDVYNKLAGNA